jgi:hypothetical protein
LLRGRRHGGRKSGRAEALRPKAGGGTAHLEEGDGGHQAKWAS